MKSVLASILFIVFISVHLSGSTAGNVRAGNRHYKNGEYEKALAHYRDAQMTSPGDPAVHFNLGDAHYKLGNYEDAASEFNRALSAKDPFTRSKIYYNLGNNAVRQQKYDEALNYFKKALELNPKDIDSKYNIEALQDIKKHPPKQGNGSKEGKGNGQDKNSGTSKNGNQKNQDKNGNSPSIKDNKSGISKEDAQRILQYYNESDKNAALKRKMMMPQLPKVDEDW